MKVLVVFVSLLFVVEGALVKGSVKSGDCVCATTTVNARNQGGLSGSVVATLSSGNCAKIYGGVITRDGYTWYELSYSGQRVWAAGNYLSKSSSGSCSAATFSGECPPIITRSQWNARSVGSVGYLSNPVKYAFIHHAESGDCFSQSSCASLVRGFQNYHMDSNGWSDIGYSFLIGGDGSVFEGRGWDKRGAHTYGYNSVGYGFCFIGSFMNKAPTDIQIQRAQQLIACGVSKGKISSSYTLRGHRDMGSTDCPGDVLYNMIRNWPHY